MMRFLLFLLAIIWGLGILDQKIQSGINKGLGEVSTFTWHQADATSMQAGKKAAHNLRRIFLERKMGMRRMEKMTKMIAGPFLSLHMNMNLNSIDSNSGNRFRILSEYQMHT